MYGFVGNNPVGRIDLLGLLGEKIVNGPSAAILSWVAGFDPTSINLAQFSGPYKALTGNDPGQGFDQRVFAGLVFLNNSSNPDPGDNFDGATKQHWGWLLLNVSITCNCQGKITKVEHPSTSGNGYIRTYGKTYADSEGNSSVSIDGGGIGQSYVLVNALHRNTVGGDARKAWEFLWPEIKDRPPWGWRRLEYILRCRRTYEIHYSGSHFPSHKAYRDGMAVATHAQTGYGAFVFSGGLAPGGQFHVETGTVPE